MHDLYLFNDADEANDFAERNISDYDSYRIIKVTSIGGIVKQIPYGEPGLLNATN